MSTIHFPHTEPVVTPSTTVAFAVVVDGQSATAEISAEALQDHFGATSFTGAPLVDAFKRNRAAIEAVARVKVPGRLAAGRGLLVSADF
jgi:hypothetical protein